MDLAQGVISGETGIGSHVPFLAAAVARTTGPVLELGMGFWSTPLLHYLCRGRRLVSVDREKEWADRFGRYQSPTHEIHVIREYEDTLAVSLAEPKWGVIFLDCSPGECRGDMAVALKGRALYLVCHDTEADLPPSGGNYGWAKVEGVYRYAVTDKSIRPWTTIYSDDAEFEL